MRLSLRILILLVLALFPLGVLAGDDASAGPSELDDQATLGDAQQKRDKLRKEIDAIDQLIASFRLIDADTGGDRDVEADVVRGLRVRDRETPDAFRLRINTGLLNRAKGDLNEAAPQSGPGELLPTQSRALALTSPEVADIVGLLVKRTRPSPPSPPDSCKEASAQAKTNEELLQSVERCAADVETAIKAWNPSADAPIKDATRALDDRKKKLTDDASKLDQTLRQLQARQTKKIDITESAVKYTVPLVGFLMLLILLAPRVYEVSAQRAIFQNGLLLELLTVYLLIATILLLGLSEKIDKNSLGTLLGGISGYVLGRTIQSRVRKERDPSDAADVDAAPRVPGAPGASVARAPASAE